MAAKAANIAWPPEESVSNEQLGTILFPNRHTSENTYLEPDYARIHSELAAMSAILAIVLSYPLLPAPYESALAENCPRPP